jgi:hypothetical protein
MINNNNILPYFRKDMSTLLTISAIAIALLMLASQLVFSNNILLLLQPAQAQSNLTFKTPSPADGTATQYGSSASITFDAQGEKFITSEQLEANGTYQITDSSSGQVLYSGSMVRVEGCCLSSPSNGDKINLILSQKTPSTGSGDFILITTSCSTSASNSIDVQDTTSDDDIGSFSGPVECSSSSSQGGGNATTTTAHPSSSSSSSLTGTTTTTAQDRDSDGDGIPDLSDRCTHNSNPRCFKEAAT